jgi:hypothetical protein
MTSYQGKQWLVGCGRYRIIGDSLILNSQEIILMPRTIGSMVKILKQKHELSDTRLLFSVKFSSFDFIELSDFSLSDNLTPHSSSMILLDLISQFGSL